MLYVFEVLDVGSGSFCFGRGSEVRVFGTSVVQVFEQMKKSGPCFSKKTTHCKSRALFRVLNNENEFVSDL